MERKIVKNIQSVLVPRGHFQNIEEASLHVQKMGFDPHFKEPHQTDNYFRFRQQPVKEGGEYRTGKVDGDKVVYMKGNGVAMLHPHMHQINSGGTGMTRVFKAPHHIIHGEHKKDVTHHAFSNKLIPEGEVHADHYKKATHEHYKRELQKTANNVLRQNRYNEETDQYKKNLIKSRRKHRANE